MEELPSFNTKITEFSLFQSSWAKVLQPVVNLPINSGRLIQGVSVVTGSNTINHKLGRKLQGWIVTRMPGAFIQIYDLQNNNKMPELTLVLNASASGTIDLFVF
jgi:hypothetical protein